ncbi:MAG: helicase-related protein [Allosphingosinicella sp.]
MTDQIDDRALALIAEGILDASDEDIVLAAERHGVDANALTAKVRRMAAERLAANAYDELRFKIGDTVALRSDPSRIGVVTGVTPTNRETRYSVFIDVRVETLYASQLALADLSARVVDASLDELNARLSALALTHPSIENLYSLQAGRIDFIPYQFRPVMKFIRADRPRLLVADEVGVGKTIEAGLLLREIQARRPLRSVLIVCSKALVVEEKWHREMRRFDEEFVTLAGPELRYCLEQTDLDGEWPDRYARAIVPFSLFNDGLINGYPLRGGGRTKGLATLEAPPRLDLLIVDEAHNARNPDTNLHHGLSLLAENAEAVVLITATPVQLGTGDLFSLLNLLRPDLVIDRPTFERMMGPNAAVNAAVAAIRAGAEGWQGSATTSLEDAASTEWGMAMLRPSPEFAAVMAAIRTADGDEDRVQLIHRAEGLHSFASMISRTRRRDIGAFTSRRPQTVPVPFTDEQRQVHDAVLAAQQAVYARTHGTGPLGFLMSTIRRQTASSLHGLVPFLEEILTRRLSEAEQVEFDDCGAEDPLDPEPIRKEVTAVLDQARSLSAHDPKLERLLEIVRQKGEMENRRLLLFSAFRHTLAYLEGAMRSRGIRIGVIHGGVGDDERRDLRRRFALEPEDPGAVDVLLSSEVGSEGLDFQFCDALVNYDIPWNPMRIEQRIGRIDRYGQRSETVAIYNFVTPGTVDYDIHERCLKRIGIFERSIGGSEAILGEIATRLQEVAEDFSLTDDERRERLQQLADNEIRVVQENEALEERQAELFGVRVHSERLQDEISRASNRWIEPTALERLVGHHLERVLEIGRNPILGSGVTKTLRLSAEARRRLMPSRPRGVRPTAAEREWEAWLKGDQPTMSLTFDREAANADRKLAFITPVHPLTQAAARAIANDETVRILLAVENDEVSPGDHPFAIYQWSLAGPKEDAMLVPVVADESVREGFVDLLASARDALELDSPGPHQLDALDSWHHDLWQQRRARHVAEAAEIATFRRDSLEASFRARMAVLDEQYQRASEDRIRRMRSGQIDRARADHRKALARIGRDEGRADILQRRVAVGLLRVERRK